MSKKIILSIIFLTAIVFSFNYVFAENMAQDAVNTVNDSMDKTHNTMQNAGNAVRDAGNSAMNVVNDTVNGTMNAVNELTKDRDNNTTNNYEENNNNMNMAGTNNNANYTATRTATEGTILGINSTAWTWLIMGAVAIAIVALVWYYAMQTSEHSYDDE